jgi:ankyrin repeat protein
MKRQINLTALRLQMSLTALSLHTLLELQNFDQARSLIRQNPECTTIQDGAYQSTALITALMHHPPLDIIDSLIQSYPQALHIKNDIGMVPLRVAIRNKASTDVILRLIDANPDAVTSFGISGKTCLHLACMHHADLKVFHRLLSIWPEAAAWKDRQGWHPLHMACLCDISEESIRAILDAYPQAARLSCSNDGELPLHFAALKGLPLVTLQEIYEKNPDAIAVRTKTHGWMPLHLACSNQNISSTTIRFLLEENRAAAQFRGKHCGSLPFDIATRCGCDPEILEMLSQASSSVMKNRGDRSESSPYVMKTSPLIDNLAH